jgi:hypothetical protein
LHESGDHLTLGNISGSGLQWLYDRNSLLRRAVSGSDCIGEAAASAGSLAGLSLTSLHISLLNFTDDFSLLWITAHHNPMVLELMAMLPAILLTVVFCLSPYHQHLNSFGTGLDHSFILWPATPVLMSEQALSRVLGRYRQ